MVERRLFVLTLVCAAVALSGCYKNQYQRQKEWQERQAKHLKANQLDTGGEAAAWRRFNVLKLRVYTDAAFARRVGGVRSYVGEWLVRANEVLTAALQLRLEVEELRDLPTSASSHDLDAVLVSLRELDPGDNVHFVLALVGKSPVLASSLHDLGRAQLLGKHLVVREMDDGAERQALSEGLDKIDPEERVRLYTQRKRHKETAVLLHELAHALGALHTRAPADLMHPNYDRGMVAFSQPNIDLMRYALDELTSEPEDRDPEALVQRIETYLTHSDWQGWIEEARNSHLAALKTSIQQAQVDKAAFASPPPPSAAPAEDLTALSEPDRATYLALEQQRREGRWTEAFEAASKLAERYRASLPVQQKACELGMQFGVALTHVQPFCDRMNSLLVGTR